MIPPDTHKKRGAALITVMFIFTVVAVIITSILSHEQIEVRRTKNMLEQTQAYQYALGAEELAKQILFSDAQLTPDITYSGQGFAKLHEGFPVTHGLIQVDIEDLQGKFNLNNILGGAVAPATYLKQLIANQGLADSLATNIISHIAGHVDNTSILRNVNGLDRQNYGALEPYITALPDTATPLNVNTASDSLLKIYIPNDVIYDRLLKIRSATGFISEQQLRAIGMNTQAMTVKSNYFRVNAEVRFGNSTVLLHSVMKRSKDTDGSTRFQVISRDISKHL